jgi:hypothetical protein
MKTTTLAFAALMAAATAQTPWTPEPYYYQPGASALNRITMEPYRIPTGGMRVITVQPVNSRPFVPVMPRRDAR